MEWLDYIEKFTEEHPVWTWVLARVLVSVCVCIIAAVGFFGIIVAIAPFVLVEEHGIHAFKAWLWMPVFVSIIWIMWSVIRVVRENFIEEW